MHKIVTITLNPSLDKSTSVKSLLPEKKLQCASPKLEPGGGGINVSRALSHLNCESLALFTSGGYTGNQFKQLIQQANIDSVAFPITNDTRENLIVVDNSNNAQYRFGMQGPQLTEEEWKQPLIYLDKNPGYEYVVASGSLPPGVPLDFFGQLAAVVKKNKAKLIIDTSGPALQHAVHEGVFMIKPNLGELSYLYGVDELRHEQVVLASRNIIANGGCQVIVVSMGASGAMLITKDEILQCASPMVKRKSTVGAGDSMVAGMVLAITKNYTWKDVLKMGIACGTAATMNEGTELCQPTDVEWLYNQLQQQ